jgi:hypothetical protein
MRFLNSLNTITTSGTASQYACVTHYIPSRFGGCIAHHTEATMCVYVQCLEQSNLLQRLGPWRLFSAAHPSCHWVLDLSNPGHEEVAKKLVALAVAGGELPNFWNIRLRGEQCTAAAASMCRVSCQGMCFQTTTSTQAPATCMALLHCAAITHPVRCRCEEAGE